MAAKRSSTKKQYGVNGAGTRNSNLGLPAGAHQAKRLTPGEIKRVTVIHINAGNDANGNPRRAYLIVDPQFGLLAAVDEGYSGFQSIEQDLGVRPINGTAVVLDVKPDAYKNALKLYGPGGDSRRVS